MSRTLASPLSCQQEVESLAAACRRAAGRTRVAHCKDGRSRLHQPRQPRPPDCRCGMRSARESRRAVLDCAPRYLPGRDYAEALYNAIGECTALVLIFSQHASASPRFGARLNAPFRDGDPIIPFRIDDAVPAAGLQFSVGAVDWLAPASVDLSTHIGILVELVIAQLTNRSGAPAVPFGPQRRWQGPPASCVGWSRHG